MPAQALEADHAASPKQFFVVVVSPYHKVTSDFAYRNFGPSAQQDRALEIVRHLASAAWPSLFGGKTRSKDTTDARIRVQMAHAPPYQP